MREEGLDHAAKMLQCDVSQCDANQLVDYFGEIYASNPSNFRFVIGDKKMIRLIRDHLIKMQNEKGTKYMRRFRKKPDRKNKVIHAPNNEFHDTDDVDDTDAALSTELSISLLQKLKTSMKSFGIDDAIVQSMTQNSVSVKTVDGIVAAEIFCALCQNDTTKKRKLNGKKVFYKSGANSKFWVLSNFTEHLKSVHKIACQPVRKNHECDIQNNDSRELKKMLLTGTGSNVRPTKRTVKNENDEQNLDTVKASTSTAQEKEIEEMASKHNFTIEYVEVDVDEEAQCSATQHSSSDQTGLMFRQISTQLSKMLTATLSNSDQIEEMAFELTENEIQSLKVASISPNGACIFGAMAHQLIGQKINSIEHMNATKQIRKDVVHHISSHYSSFEKELRDRVYAEINPDSIKDIRKECKTILNHYLPLDHYWGGAETMKAVREMYKVNILVLNERGTCHFFNHFNQDYNRTLLLAFRLQDKTATEIDIDSYNHYDSVCDISADTIPQILDIFLKRMQKMNVEFNDTL